MAAAVQVAFILLYLIVIATSFALIGKEPENPSKYKAYGQTAFIHGIFTVAFLIWWDTPDLISLCGKSALLGMMWIPWIIDLANIHKPQEPITLADATIGTLICAARIGLVLGFWTLY